MASVNIPYLCTTIGNLSGVPIRLYRGGDLALYHSMVELPRDPLALCREAVFSISDHVGCHVTPQFHYYGVLNAGDVKLVIGPTRQIPESEQELRELAFQLDLSGQQAHAFAEGMRCIVRMPIESIMQMLCAVNHVLNGETLELKDLCIYEQEQTALLHRQETLQVRRQLSADFLPAVEAHNTYDLEQLLLQMVRKGDTAAMRKWMAAAPAVRGGVVANDQLRQRKNLFVVTVTLVSRAAVQGGMEVEDAFTRSDSYIQQCELLPSPDRVTNLQYRMLLDYTGRVERLRLGRQPTKLALDVANYVQHHLSETITTAQIADALFLSRSYLSRKFKAATGESLADFVLKEKTEEAKRLLRYSDKSLTAIGSYLGFSSPSHFSRVFKQCCGCSPREYRAQYEAAL